MADPFGRSKAMEAFSFKQLVFEPFLGGGLVTALSPLLIVSWGLPRFTLVALVLTLLSMVFGLQLGRRPQPR
jgi:ESS family glutamate:Na+ symporter